MAVTLPADGCVLKYWYFGLGDQGPTHWRLSFILWLIIINPSLIYCHQMQKKIIFWPKTLKQGAAYWCSGCHLLIIKGFWGPSSLLACTYLNDHVRLLKHYHVKCLMPALFLPPEFTYQSIPDPELSCTFLCRLHPVGVQTWLQLLKTFYYIWIPLPRI